MPGVRGKTNNPNGRPPKERSLTACLSIRLDKTIDMDGKRVSGKDVVAQMVTDVLTTGKLQFPGEVESSIVSVKDWMDFAKWAYGYLEPPVNKNEHTGKGGGPIEHNVHVYVPDNGRPRND